MPKRDKREKRQKVELTDADLDRFNELREQRRGEEEKRAYFGRLERR